MQHSNSIDSLIPETVVTMLPRHKAYVVFVSSVDVSVDATFVHSYAVSYQAHSETVRANPQSSGKDKVTHSANSKPKMHTEGVSSRDCSPLVVLADVQWMF